MQPLTKHREVSSEGVTESTTFGLSLKNSPHLKRILRKGIYSDKVLAVLREYSANAWDAHRMVGKHDLPIEIQLPTWSDPTLVIKDFGPGLSHDDAFNVFTQYGDSTKRETNDAVGMLGIGSKSGFAYSDTFTVVSRHGGKKRTYVALLDEDENDRFDLLLEEDLEDPSDTGLTIQLGVRQEDIGEFTRKAQALFQHFSPRPVINVPLRAPPAVAAKLKEGLIYDHDGSHASGWYAVMGCIPYKIDLEQLKGPDGQSLISDSFLNTSGLLYFGIGEVQISSSRESLEYMKLTKQVLVSKFEALLEEYVKMVLDEVENGGGTDWEKRLNMQRLLRFNLGKKEIGEFAEDRVFLKDPPEALEFSKKSIPVQANARLVRMINPDGKAISGFELDYSTDIQVMPAKVYETDANGTMVVDTNGQPILKIAHTWDTAQPVLEQYIIDRKLTGLTVVDLKDLPWSAPPPPPPKPVKKVKIRVYSKKHSVSLFKLVGTREEPLGEKRYSYAKKGYFTPKMRASDGFKPSDNWAVVDHTPSADDVFVVVSHFLTDKALDGFNLFPLRSQDEQVAKFFGIQLPTIYGYKTTDKKPVDPKTVDGTHYLEWRKKFLAGLPIERIHELLEKRAWSKTIDALTLQGKLTWGLLNKIVNKLGADHPIASYLMQARASKYTKGEQNALKLLHELGVVPADYVTKPKALLEQIQKTYPLLKVEGLPSLWREYGFEWQRYVKLIDREGEQIVAPVVVITIPADISVPPEKVEG